MLRKPPLLEKEGNVYNSKLAVQFLTITCFSIKSLEKTGMSFLYTNDRFSSEADSKISNVTLTKDTSDKLCLNRNLYNSRDVVQAFKNVAGRCA